MKKGRGALLGACLALPLAGITVPSMAQPGCGPQGQGVAIEPMTAAEQVQAERLIADANAMFRQMDAEMSAVQAQMAVLMAMPLPTPQQLVQASLGPGGWIAAGPGTGTVITEVSTGNGGTCNETITYSYPANGGRPMVHVSDSGDACGTITVNGPGQVQAAQPVAPYSIQPTVPVSPIPTTPDPRLWQAVYRYPAAPTPQG
jgi:hypothetical protein